MTRSAEFAPSTRRDLLKGLVCSCVGALLFRPAMAEDVAGYPSASGTTHLPFLAALVYALYPHAALAPSVYEDVARTLSAKAVADPSAAGLLGAASAALDAASNGNWLALAPAQRAAVLEGQQAAPFFAFVRATSAYLLYTREDVWKAFGYGGDAWRFGGYSPQQLNDIDWLPDPAPHQ